MKFTNLCLPTAALGVAVSLFTFTPQSEGWTTLGFSIGLGQRDFRVFNNFTDATANNNQTPDVNFPGYQGADMSIWKACIEWASRLHGDGQGDPSQAFGLGSGGANFDPSFQGNNTGVGGINDNTHSELPGQDGGVLAFTESPGSNGCAVFFDAITDPLTGSLSDGHRSRWGRRHPFMYGAAVPFAVVFYLLFTPPAGLGQIGLLAWLMLFSVAARGALTLYAVPHMALSAEMTTDYRERTTLAAVRSFFGLGGSISVLLMGFGVFFQPGDGFANSQLNPATYPPFARTAALAMREMRIRPI